jgi:hypothetical protein
MVCASLKAGQEPFAFLNVNKEDHVHPAIAVLGSDDGIRGVVSEFFDHFELRPIVGQTSHRIAHGSKRFQISGSGALGKVEHCAVQVAGTQQVAKLLPHELDLLIADLPTIVITRWGDLLRPKDSRDVSHRNECDQGRPSIHRRLTPQISDALMRVTQNNSMVDARSLH